MFACRECEREINQSAEVCPYCGTDLTQPPPGEARPEKRASLTRTVFRYSVLLAAIWGFLWYVLPERHGREAAALAETRAVEAIREAQAALVGYAAAQQGAYPPSLDALPAQSAGRVKAAAQAALSEGYALEYKADSSLPHDRPRRFVLLARPRNFGYRSFFLDESGVIRATREFRAASAQDKPIED
jgi:hypothetical protein